MARQNIDEEWKTDPRRGLLAKRLGNPRLADGMRVEVNWMILDHKGSPIPLKKFQFVENFQDWLDSGLGKVLGDLVHIAGADRYKEFFDKQKENGLKGGRPPKPKETQNNPGLPKGSQTKPENPSFSISSSISISKERRDTVKSDSASESLGVFISIWNNEIKTLPKVKDLTPKRKKALSVLSKVRKEEEFRAACIKVEASEFLSGRSGKWTSCGFDWVVKPDNFQKILEGLYDNRGQSAESFTDYAKRMGIEDGVVA
jgi:hypothetical protein